MLPQADLNSVESSIKSGIILYRKRPHFVLGTNEIYLPEDVELEPQVKHSRTPAAVNDSVTNLISNTPVTVPVSPVLASNGISFPAPAITRDAQVSMPIDDVEMAPLSSSPIDVDDEEDVASSSETKPGDPQLVFKVPLMQLLTSPREKFVQDNPWLQANSADKALVVWQPSPFDVRSSGADRDVEAEETIRSHLARRRRDDSSSKTSSSSSSSSKRPRLTDDDADSGHAGEANDIDID